MVLRTPIPSMEGTTTERLAFRRPVIDDERWWMEYINDAEAIRFMAFRQGDPEEARRFIQRSLDRIEKDGACLNVILDRSTGEPLGMAGLLTQEVDGEAELEIGYHLLPSAWGMGYAIEAARACRDFAEQHGLCASVISLIDPTNVRSQRVAIRNGMLPEKVSVHRGRPAVVFRYRFAQG